MDVIFAIIAFIVIVVFNGLPLILGIWAGYKAIKNGEGVGDTIVIFDDL